MDTIDDAVVTKAVCQRCLQKYHHDENQPHNKNKRTYTTVSGQIHYDPADDYQTNSVITIKITEHHMNNVLRQYQRDITNNLDDQRLKVYTNSSLVGKMIIFFELLNQRYISQYSYDTITRSHHFTFLSCNHCEDHRVFIDLVLAYGQLK